MNVTMATTSGADTQPPGGSAGRPASSQGEGAGQAAAGITGDLGGSGGTLPPAVGGPPPTANSRCANGNLIPSASNLPAVDAATLCLVNGARRDAGLPGFVESRELDWAAVGHTTDMVTHGYFDHTGPDGLSVAGRVQASGFVPSGPDGGIGENIGAATMSDATPAAMIASWLRSPPHRANILDPELHQTGLGVAAAVPATVGNQPGATYTLDFA